MFLNALFVPSKSGRFYIEKGSSSSSRAVATVVAFIRGIPKKCKKRIMEFIVL